MSDIEPTKPERKPVQTRAVNVRETTYQMVTEAARERGISRALVVRIAMEQFLARSARKGGAK